MQEETEVQCHAILTTPPIPSTIDGEAFYANLGRGSHGGYGGRYRGGRGGGHTQILAVDLMKHIHILNLNLKLVIINSLLCLLFPNLAQCQIFEKFNHSALQCRHRFNHFFVADDILYTFAAMSLHEPGEEVWYPDIGAFNHMTANPGILSSSKLYTGQDKILVGNESLLNITQTGETNLKTSSTSFAIKNVLVVSSIKRNLLSIRQFCHDNNSLFELTCLVYCEGRGNGEGASQMPSLTLCEDLKT